jgi:hypothetical protein
MAGAEVFARAPQHNDFDRVIVHGAAKTCVQRIGHLRVLRVVKVRPVHGQGGDAAAAEEMQAQEISDRVTVKFIDDDAADGNGPGGRGLPSYRLEPEHGHPWRSRYDGKANDIIINSSHRDFLASKSSVGKHRRYIGKLYAKEVVLSNFPHESPAQALERLIEVTLRTEDAL